MSTNELKITVQRFKDRENLVLVHYDPLTGKRKTRSAKTTDERKAHRAAVKWEEESQCSQRLLRNAERKRHLR